MTTTPTTTSMPPEDPTETTEADTLTPDTPTPEDNGTEPVDTLSAEAARYRRRLRAVEGERDHLAGVVERYQRAEVERLAADAGMARPGDLWVVGTDLAGLLGDDGAVDAEAVSTLVADILSERPTWRIAVFPDLGQGARGIPIPPVSWAQALDPMGGRQ
jgi:hypothetical protein